MSRRPDPSGKLLAAPETARRYRRPLSPFPARPDPLARTGDELSSPATPPVLFPLVWKNIRDRIRHMPAKHLGRPVPPAPPPSDDEIRQWLCDQQETRKPIRPEFRHCYRGPAWQATRARILQRAKHCCEKCGVPNYIVATRAMAWWTIAPERWWFIPWKPDQFPGIVWRNEGGVAHDGDNFPREICRQVRIVLTIAHLNNVPGDDRDENLKALCQYCHLATDQRFHRQTRCARKDAARPLLREMAS